MVGLKREVEDLNKQVKELTEELEYKKLALYLVEGLDKLIRSNRGKVITAQSAAVMTACAQLRALLLADPPYDLKDKKHVNETKDADWADSRSSDHQFRGFDASER